MQEHQFLFIAGLHRSGTSLLHSILRDHPSISGFKDTPAEYEDEGQFLQSVYPLGRAFGGPGRFAFKEGAHMTESHPLATPGNAEKLFGEWRRYWNLERPVLMEKSPPNIVRTRFLQALFPAARVLAILRHPVAVAYATQKWSETPIPSLIDHSLTAYEIFYADRPYLQHCHVVYYEDFIERPQDVVDGILDFLGLEGLPLSHSVSRAANAKYFERWRGERRRLWHPVMPWVPRKLEARARRVGYSLKKACRV